MADLAVMENIEKKTGPIEEGRTLKIMNLNLDEIKILLGSEKVTKNQKKRLLKRQKANSQNIQFNLYCINYTACTILDKWTSDSIG